MSHPALRASYLVFTLTAVILVVSAAALLSRHGMEIWSPGDSKEPASIKVAKNETLPSIIRTVAEGRDFPPARMVSFYARVTESDRKVKKGRYAVPGEWSPAQFIEQLAIGANDPNRVTIPPGLTVRQAAHRAAEAGWIRAASALIEASTGEAARLICGKPTLEGMILPETYFFDAEAEAGEVLSVLHTKWRSSIETLVGHSNLDAHTRNGLTLYDTVILASLVEKEAADVIEMATVSSVFHNRIRKNWPLGASATIRYAIDDWERGEHQLPVNLNSPFNTNRRPGLPPHPICSPGPEALQAALSPPDTPYFFFVADGDGKSIFNITHEEHIRAARDYRRKMAERRSSP